MAANAFAAARLTMVVNTTGKKEAEVVLQSVRGVEERLNSTTGMRAGVHGLAAYASVVEKHATKDITSRFPRTTVLKDVLIAGSALMSTVPRLRLKL